METLASQAGGTRILFGPHSLGILIEWKPYTRFFWSFKRISPHSLGILIEWKLAKRNAFMYRVNVPTRWGY